VVLAANIAYAMALLWLGLTARPIEVPVMSTADWLAHGLAYGTQTILLFALVRRLAGPRSSVLLAGLGAIAFGATVEILQRFQPARYFQVADLVANAVGVAVAVTLLAIFLAIRPVSAQGHQS